MGGPTIEKERFRAAIKEEAVWPSLVGAFPGHPAGQAVVRESKPPEPAADQLHLFFSAAVTFSTRAEILSGQVRATEARCEREPEAEVAPPVPQ